MKKTILTIVAVLLIVGLGGRYLAGEANAAEPGDLLYPVDLATESVERFFTFDEVASAELEEDILDERIDELEALTEAETVDEDLVLEATDNVIAQQDRVQTRLEDETGAAAGDLEQVRNRYEEQIEEHLQIMEQVQTKVEGDETQLKVQEAVDAYEESKADSTNGSDNSNSSNGNSSSGNGNK